MRDLFFLAVLSSFIPAFFIAPHVGVLVWVWLGAMNPHRLVWGFAYSLPVVMMVSLATWAAWAASREPKRLPMNAVTVLLLVLMVWSTITTFTALSPSNAWYYWDRAIKTWLLALTVLALINNQVRIHSLVWILVISFGWFGVKAGMFTGISGGGNLALGPPDSMIGNRNHFSLAMCMTLPLMNYLRMHSQQRLIRIGLTVAMLLTIVGVIGTYSRGGFVALSVTLFFFWLKSRGKVITVLIGALLLVPAIQFMPDKWMSRMETIQSAEDDGSFQGRLDAWQFALNVASQRPIFSGGFGATYDDAVFGRYAGDTRTHIESGSRAAHSIYFEILGDHGFIGLAIFLGMLYASYHNCAVVRRRTRGQKGMKWSYDLAAMLQVSLVAYLVAGIVQTMAYFEGMYVLLALIVNLRVLVDRALAPAKTGPAVAPVLGAARPPALAHGYRSPQ